MALGYAEYGVLAYSAGIIVVFVFAFYAIWKRSLVGGIMFILVGVGGLFFIPDITDLSIGDKLFILFSLANMICGATAIAYWWRKRNTGQSLE